MHHRPFFDKIQSPAWQLAFEDLQGADFNRGFEFAVLAGGKWLLWPWYGPPAISPDKSTGDLGSPTGPR